MNNDYISRADVLSKSQIMNDFSWATGCGILTDVAAVTVIDIEAIPAADVRPVVLCRDCRYYNHGWCYNPNTFDDEKTRGNTSPEWFCADGRRREGGADNA